MTCYVDVTAVPGGAAAFAEGLADIVGALFVECEVCGDHSLRDSINYVEGHRGRWRWVADLAVCDDCLSSCSWCDDPISSNLEQTIEGRRVCSTCYDVVRCCSDCGFLFDSENGGIWAGDNPVCDDCRSEYSYCHACDDYIANDEGVCMGCEHCSDCGCECEGSGSCDDRTGVYGWDYKPAPVFFGNAPHDRRRLYFGLELEIERANSTRLTVDHVGEVSARLGDLAYVKHDGSLADGFEIVTHPMTFDYWFTLDAFDDLLREFSRWGCNSWNGHTCGFHVHLSRSAFTLPHLHAFTLFWYRNRGPVASISGRRERELERWARLSAHDGRLEYGEPRLIEKVRRTNPGARYMAVNLQNSSTVEIRVFRGSLRVETIRGYVELCHAVYLFTKGMTSRDILHGSLSWSSFLDFCRAQGFDDVVALAATRGVC